MIALLSLITLMCLLIGMIQQRHIYDNSNLNSDTYVLNHWKIPTSDGESSVTMPYAFQWSRSEPSCRISCNLDSSMSLSSAASLMLPLKYCELNVYLDDALIFTESAPENGFSRTKGVPYLLIPLPQDYSGKKLTLEFTPLLEAQIQYKLSAPLIGTGLGIICHEFKREFVTLALEILLIIFGIQLFMLGYIMREKSAYQINFCYLGIFSLCCGVYLLSQMVTTHLLIPNIYTVYFLEFATLPLLIFTIAVMIRIHTKGLLRTLFNLVMGLFIIIILAEWGMNFILGIDLRSTLILTHLMVPVLLFCIILSVFRPGDMAAGGRREILLSIMPMVVGGALDMMFYYMSAVDISLIYFKLGLVSFVMMQAYFNYRHYIRSYKERIQAKAYKELALKDVLTGIPNRLAYDQDLKSIPTHSSSRACCLSIDVNNLKTVNDNFGHGAGDELIRGMAHVLRDAVGSDGRVYRIGGDEFIVLIEDDLMQMQEQIMERICRQTEAYNRDHAQTLSFAVGTARFDPACDPSAEHMVARADHAMYEMKRQQKSHAAMSAT